MHPAIRHACLLLVVASVLAVPAAPALAAPAAPSEDAPGQASDAGLPSALERVLPALPPALRERVRDGWQRGAPALERRLRRAEARLPGRWPQRSQRLRERMTSGHVQRFSLSLLALLAFTWWLVRRLGGRADLVVCLDYPAELRGSFSVRLVERRELCRPRPRGQRAADAGRPSSWLQHNDVSRETRFRRLRAREWGIVVEGSLSDPDSGEVVAEPGEARWLALPPRHTTRAGFAVTPRGCLVDVSVTWDRRPLGEAVVAEQGHPDSLRYARAGRARLRLAQGSHRLVAGSGDRVAECCVQITGWKPSRVELDLAGPQVVFKGCPPAVEPFVRGNLSVAARELRKDGQDALAHRLLARLYVDQGEVARAAEHLQAAGHADEAGELLAASGDWRGAAAAFEAHGDWCRAARGWEEAGELSSAGRAWESAGDLAAAARCFRAAGDDENLLLALERGGSAFEAARLARDLDDRQRVVSLLEQVPAEDPRFADACEMLAEAYEAAGDLSRAAERLHLWLDALTQAGVAAPREECLRLSGLWEGAGDVPRALEALERVAAPDRDALISARMETLRKQISPSLAATAVDDGTGYAATGYADTGRYEIQEQIGRGGMGVVFKALDRRLGRTVALKRLPDEMGEHPGAVELFLREGRAAAALNHPNIVTLFDADREQGQYFLTMELLEGTPLSSLLKQRGPLDAASVASLGGQVAAGLQYAHERRIIHRDIKPGNLFVTGEGVVKIMDFGLAKMLEEVRRSATVVGGTPYYVAPEQAQGLEVDARADLYSLGVTLFVMAVGRVPFKDGDVAFQHVHSAPPDPRSLRPDLGDPLAELILALLAKDPAQRPATAGEVARRLGPIARRPAGVAGGGPRG